MKEQERNDYIRILQEKVEFNKRIHCPYVAAKWQRMIEELKKEKR